MSLNLKSVLVHVKPLALGWLFQWRSGREPGWDTPLWLPPPEPPGAGLSCMLPTVTQNLFRKLCRGIGAARGLKVLLVDSMAARPRWPPLGGPGRASVLGGWQSTKSSECDSCGDGSLQEWLEISIWDHLQVSSGPKSNESIVIRHTGKKLKGVDGKWRSRPSLKWHSRKPKDIWSIRICKRQEWGLWREGGLLTLYLVTSVPRTERGFLFFNLPVYNPPHPTPGSQETSVSFLQMQIPVYSQSH